MIVRKTRKDEEKRLNEVFSIAFELPMEAGSDEENPKIHHWAAYEDRTDQMMSTFTISDFMINFDGAQCKMGGIGGVATLPQYRRQGGIRGCFQKALPDMYNAGYDFSYLYPFSTAYYRKFGYECCVQKMHVSVNLGLLRPGKAEGYTRMCEGIHPMTDAIMSIDSFWEKQYNMMVRHEPDDYSWVSESAPAEKLEFTYVYYNTEDHPLAYTTFKKEDQSDGRNLVCSRFVFLNQEGFHGLMHLFKSFSADHMFVKFALPATEAMEYMLPEWSMGAASWHILNAGMVRVINVESILKKAIYIGSGSIKLKITDGQILQNNGCFDVIFENGKAISVAKTQDAPDAEMEINIFSALISGVASFKNAVNWMEGLKVLQKDACFNQVFYPKSLMISDYF